MHAAVDIANRLRLIADLAPGAMGDEGVWLAGVIDRFLVREDFEDALGLPRRGTPWRRLVVAQQRDRLLVQLVGQFHPGIGEAAAAKAVVNDLKSYAGRAWSRRRGSSAPPTSDVGSAREFYWRILAATDGRIPSWKRVYAVLLDFSPDRPSDETTPAVRSLRNRSRQGPNDSAARAPRPPRRPGDLRSA